MMTWTTPPRRLRASPAGPGPSRTSQPARHPCATPMAERRRIDWRCRRVAWTTESRARAKDPGRGGRARRVARRTMPMRRGRTSRRGSCGRWLRSSVWESPIGSEKIAPQASDEKIATDPNTGRSLSNDSEKSAKSAGHPRRRLPLDPDLRAPPLIDAPARRDQSPHCERHSTLASYETNPASNVRLLTRPALGTSSRDPASAVPSRPAPAAPFRRTPDRRRLHLFPQVIRLKRDTERSK